MLPSLTDRAPGLHHIARRIHHPERAAVLTARPKTAQPADRQEAILKAAAHLFRIKGYDAATTREIAQALGLSKAGFYHHVPSKQDLLFQIMDRFITRFLASTQESYALNLPPDEKMRVIIQRHVSMLAEWLDEAQVTHESRRALKPDQLASYLAKRDAYQNLFVKVINDGIASGHFRHCNAFLMSHTILDILNGMLRWYSPPGPPTLDEITAYMVDLIVERILK